MIEAISEKTIKLLLRHKEPMTSKQIANEIGMSESSIKHNMKEVRAIISSIHASLKSVPGKGFWIECDEVQRQNLSLLVDQDRDKTYSFHFRRNYILEVLFQENGEYTIQIFADDLGVGKNVIIKDLEAIEKWLSFFDIKLNRIRNRGIMIEGGEFDIRQAIIYNHTSLMESMDMNLERPDDLDFRISKTFYNYFSKVYNQECIYDIQNILLACECELDYHFEDFSCIQLLEYIYVSLQRIKAGHSITERTVLHHCKVTPLTYQSAKHILCHLNVGCDVDDAEIHCMAAQLTLYGAYEDALSDSFIKDEFYENEARNFLDRLQNIILNQNIMVNENLIDDIATLFKKKKMQKSYQIMNSNYLKYDIKRELPSLYAIVLANIQPLEYALNAKFTENDIVYFAMLIDNAIEETSDEINMLFITTFDEHTARYLVKKIKRSIRMIRIDRMIHPDDFIHEDVSKYDVCLTTVLMDDERVIKISRRVDTYDLRIIEREVEKKRKDKQTIIVRDNQLFHEDLICCNFKARKKEEVIEQGVKMLTQQGYTNEAFYDVLLQRENFVSTAIGNGVAIPHGYKTEIIRSGIATFKLDRPIDWTEQEKVELVFIIAIELDDPKEIYDFFAKFYALLDDKQRLAKVMKANNSHELFLSLEHIGTISK